MELKHEHEPVKKRNKSRILASDWFCSKNAWNQVRLTRNRYDPSNGYDYGRRS